MKKKIITLIYGQMLLLLLASGLAAAATEPELQKLRHTVLSPTSEQVVLQLNGSYIPKVFTLKDETPRIVFDFPDMTYGREIKNITTTNGAIVKRIRVGMHTKEALKTRVVFDVTTFKGMTYTQKFDEKSSTLTIQFTSPAKAAAPGPGTQKATSADKHPSKSADTAAKTDGKKSTDTATAQAQPETTVDSKAIEKTAAAQADSGSKAESTAPTTAPQPTVTADKADEKKTSATPQPHPNATADTKASTKTEAGKSAAATGPGVGPLLESVKFDGTSPKGEMVKFKLNGFHPPAVHGVEEGIPRVICDFNSTQLVDSTKNIIKTEGKYIKVIRISKSKKPERVRVVLDLEPNRSYDLQQVFFKEDNLFVIIVNTAKK